MDLSTHDFAATVAHGFGGAPDFLARDFYHLGEPGEIADAVFEARKQEARDTKMAALLLAFGIPHPVPVDIPATDDEAVTAVDEHIGAGQIPALEIVLALRGDTAPLMKWARRAFEQAADEAADSVRWTR